MVVFSCNGCGEMLKKNQVDSHAARCRSCSSVSCIDCSVSFYGDDFRTHTSCITEAERYEKSVYRGGNKKAKRNPQEAWMDLIVAASLTAPASIRQYMEMLASLDNVPRKPKQFRNFTANSLNLRGKHATRIVDSLWNHLSELRAKEQDAKVKEEGKPKHKMEEDEHKNRNEQEEKDTSDVNEPAKELTASCASENMETEGTRKRNDISPKKVKKAMKKVLKKAPGQKMKVKALRRAVRNYLECDKSCKPKVKAIIGEQLVGSDLIRVDGKLVILR